MNKTVFVDIDGTILEHMGSLSGVLNGIQKTLDGVHVKFKKWEAEGTVIILVTARPESMRQFTEKQLTDKGLYYQQLIMGCGNGPRYLYNDMKPDGKMTAFVVNLKRNKGL